MPNPIPPAATVLVLALVASSCGSSTTRDAAGPEPRPGASRTPAVSPTPTPSSSSSAPKPGTVVTTGPSDFGPMLFDAQHQAIYIWESEESDRPECYGGCAEAWPPVLTDGTPVARGRIDESLLGTTKRRDNTTQVTYNGRPLYFYAHEGPGEVKCHNISTHGGLWWVIQPDGERAP